ncbi:sugar transporter domain-containing protein [Phthorimaea operculella]|nr:sugar transporter domain-containing protein [Phthorimaea operculella]
MGIPAQLFTSFVASFGTLLIGFFYAWPSYTMELFTSSNTSLLSSPMTELEVSLVGSLPSLGAIIGTLLVIPIIDNIGRQKGGIVLSLFYPIAWSIIYLSSSSTLILVASFIMGIGGGAFLTYSHIYIFEIVQDSIRGSLIVAPICFLCFGTLVSNISGWFLSYKTIILINITLSVINLLMFTFIKDSPVYLIKKGRFKAARQAISVYRGGSYDTISQEISRLKGLITPADVELSALKDLKEKGITEAEKEVLHPVASLNKEDDPQMSALKFLYLSPSSRRAFIICNIHTTLQACMHVIPVLIYANPIFTEAAPDLSSNFCSVLFSATLLGGMVVSGLITDLVGRRFLLIGSSILVAVCTGSVAFLMQTKLAPAWINAVIILFYCFIFNCGAGSMPFVLIGESFIPKVLGLVTMIATEWIWLVNFFVITAFPPAVRLIDVHGIFYFYAAVATLNAALAFVWVPETKGLSIEQIQDAYVKRR